MYEITCPECNHDNTLWEVEGAINMYVPHKCEKCKKWFYIFQRSFFDPFYDNTSVEVRKFTWIKSKEKELIKSGEMTKGKKIMYFYKPTWDIYAEYGGYDVAMSKIKKMWNE